MTREGGIRANVSTGRNQRSDRVESLVFHACDESILLFRGCVLAHRCSYLFVPNRPGKDEEQSTLETHNLSRCEAMEFTRESYLGTGPQKHQSDKFSGNQIHFLQCRGTPQFKEARCAQYSSIALSQSEPSSSGNWGSLESSSIDCRNRFRT